MNRSARLGGLLGAALLTVLLWRLPFGGYLLYPFSILATWFHETGHGLAALGLGGSFHRLSLFANGSGLALTSGPLWLGPFGPALVAAAGPLAPALAGSLLILASRRAQTARTGIGVLAGLMIVSLLLWVRSGFALLVIGILAALLLWIVAAASPGLRIWTVQFLGVQASISMFFQIDYLFTRQVVIGGKTFLSDTGQMAQALLLPYWCWAVVLIALALLLPYRSLRRALSGQ